MPLTIFAVLTLSLAMTFHARAATVVDMQLIRAAFFSDACRQQAETLGITSTSDANALVAAFAGLKPRPANSPAPEGQRDDCGVPTVAVINLLRLNGIDAELVSATMAKEAAPADQVERVLVYVPALPLFRSCAAARRAKPRRSARSRAGRAQTHSRPLARRQCARCLPQHLHACVHGGRQRNTARARQNRNNPRPLNAEGAVPTKAGPHDCRPPKYGPLQRGRRDA
jgi:hypothetical protein